MPRKRGHINLTEKLAAALACLLSQEQRDDLRTRKVPAKEILSLFEFDHVVLHCHEGSDDWSNLTPMPKQPHREKSKKDTTIAAKVVRLDERWSTFTKAIGKGRKPKRPKSKWPKQKFPRRKNNG